MTAYYNECDKYAAEWLLHLIWEDLIAPGIVDTRSIEDVTPNYLKGFDQCHFFAGIGVWSHSLRLAGWPDDRQVWTGSCPCQPFSSAGKIGGFDDERHLWPAWFHLIDQCRPSVIFGEQVASPDGLAWLELVHADLEAANCAVGAFDLCAAGVGAPHIRQRLYFVADNNNRQRASSVADLYHEEHHVEPRGAVRARIVGHSDGANFQRYDGEQPGAQISGRDQSDSNDAALASRVGRLADANKHKRSAIEHAQRGVNAARPSEVSFWSGAEWLSCTDGRARPVEPGTFPLAYGAPKAFVGRLRAYGNSIVAPLAAEFIRAYANC